MADGSFRALVENAPDAIVVSRNGIVLYANAAAARLLGHDSVDELVGKPMTFLDRRSVEVMRRRIEQMATTGERLVPREYPARRRDGTEITAEIASTIIDFEGEPAVLAYARDVTERTRLRAQLAHADRLASLGMMAAGVAHEINNPLTFIGLAADMLKERVAQGESALVLEMRMGIDRIAAIVRDLRFFGRDEDEPVGPVDLNAAIEAAERLVAHEMRPRAAFTKDYGQLAPVMGAARRLEQVFVNLLLNAALSQGDKYGRVVVRAHTTDDHVVVSIEDDGCGIPKEHLDIIFEPFFTTRAGAGGTGLGLSICRDIIVRAGGNLTVKSTGPEGTTMELTLVRAKREEKQPAAQPVKVTVTADKRVLVIDDEPLIVQALTSMLAHHATVVGETVSARALELILTEPSFDVIVCDVMMPGLSGVDLHERVARERPGHEARFVFITGGMYTSRARDYLERLPNRRLLKPFDLPLLLEAIAGVAGASP